MSYLDILAYSNSILADITFMMAMLIVAMVSACFLGRYLVISKKMVIATIGVVVIQILFWIIGQWVISEMFPQFATLSAGETINESSPDYATYSTMVYVLSYVLNGLVFIFAFVFYFVAFKEKRLLRSIEATICLYLYYSYFNSIIVYSYVYLNNVDYEEYFRINSMPGSEEGIRFNFAFVLCQFIISLIILLLLYFRYYRKKHFYVIQLQYRIFFVIWLFLFFMVLIIPLNASDNEHKLKILNIMFGLLIPFIGAAAPVLIIMNAAEKSLKDKNKYQEYYLSEELKYIEQYKKAQTETRAFRHDIVNNLSLANMLLDEGKTEEASMHIKELLGNVSALSPKYITGDEMLDCIVAMKAAKMDELGIAFSNDGVIDGGLNIKPMDICGIFANALDNAIEAASKTIPVSTGSPKSSDYSDKANNIDNTDKSNNIDNTGSLRSPWIDMNIKRTKEFFIISISNSATEKIDTERILNSSGYTSKKDTEHHGFGLSNIRRTIEQYNGLLKAESDEESFTLKIILPR